MNILVHKIDNLLNEILFEELAEWLQPKLETIHGADSWWEKGVYGKLSEKQKRKLKHNKNGNLSELDLLALLHASINNFRELNYTCGISWDLRTPLESARDARNAISHREGGRPPEAEDLLLFALSIRKVMKLIDALPDKIAIADDIIHSINDPEYSNPKAITLDELSGGKLGKLLNEEEPAKKINISVVMDKKSKHKEENITAILQNMDYPDHDKVAPGKIVELNEGLNELLPAELKSCEQNSAGKWSMVLMLNSDKGNKFTISVPDYLADSAKAAADILSSIKARSKPPIIYLNLLNVNYKNGKLYFLDEPNDNKNAYPLIVIQPSYMINVTALTYFEYCPRNYLMDRYSIAESNQSMQRGALVHNLFEYILKNPVNNENLMEQCHESIDKLLPNLTMQGVSPQSFYDDVRHHLNVLAQDLNKALDFSLIEDVFIERYMINPELGLKGKIDALVHKNNGSWQALELKTGKSWGDAAKPGHAWQVSAYHLLLVQAKIRSLDPPCVIYTGNQAQKLRNAEKPLKPKTMIKEVSFSVKNAIQMINMRNFLVSVDYTGELEFNQNTNKCNGCLKMGNEKICIKLHALGLSGGKEHPKCLDSFFKSLRIPLESIDLFKKMNQALLEEFQAIRFEHGQLLQMRVDERIAKGVCLEVKNVPGAINNGVIELSFPDSNNSEFREGDPCLLSDEGGPIKGNCIEVYIREIDKDNTKVTLPKGVKELWFEPKYLDVNAPDTAFERNFAALFNLWDLAGDQSLILEPIRKVLLGEISALRTNELIQCDINSVDPLPNPIQVKGVNLAMGLKDILLIQGPPGTGKTYTLALVVKKLVSEGKTIAIATYTHRAADETISKLITLAPEIEVRKLGRAEAVSAQHVEKCLDSKYKRKDNHYYRSQKEEVLEDLKERQEDIYKILSDPCVYVGTTYAWLSGQYDALPLMMYSDRVEALFDYMIVDEASQVITPNLAGVLRLAKKWILVGDHMQLPPIIKGETQGILKNTLFEQIAKYPNLDESILIQLDTQHRMPSELADFIGNTFYSGNLKTELAKATRVMNYNHPMLQDERCIALINVKQDDLIKYKNSKEEANWVGETVKELHESGWPMRDESGKPTIGIIAPYRAQVALLRRCLEEVFKGSEEFETGFWNQVVDTVDRFQGDERDIIVISLCIRPNETLIPRIYEEKRRINVSLSRAKQKLWIVGFIQGMELVPGLREFKEYAESNPQVCAIISETNDE